MSLSLPSRCLLRRAPRTANSIPRRSCARSFLTLPNADAQNLAATRTLPYPHEPLYDLIADVDSYSRFVPYCSHSRVTQWSKPDAHGRRWPELADLHVGWGGFSEEFSSRLRCVPGVSVEAVSGEAEPNGQSSPSSVFKSLTTRWSLKPITAHSSPATQVHLEITYQFVNPLYAAVSSAVSDQVAKMMVEAFEKQASQKLGH